MALEKLPYPYMAATIWKKIDKQSMIYHDHAMNHDDHAKKHGRHTVIMA